MHPLKIKFNNKCRTGKKVKFEAGFCVNSPISI